MAHIEKWKTSKGKFVTGFKSHIKEPCAPLFPKPFGLTCEVLNRGKKTKGRHCNSFFKLYRRKQTGEALAWVSYGERDRT